MAPSRTQTPTAPEPFLERARERFEALERARAGREPAWLSRMRRESLARFQELGIPTVKDEEWKYTSAAPIARLALRTAAAGVSAEVRRAVEPLLLRLPGGLTLVFVNGRFAADLSSMGAPPPGLHVEPLSRALARDPGLVEAHLDRGAGAARRAFTALNTATFEDGAFVRLGKDTCLPVPIDLLYVSAAMEGEPPPAVAPRTLIVAEQETRVTVVERHVAVGPEPYFSNAVTEITLQPNSAVEHVFWQQENDAASHVSSIHVRQERDSRFVGHALSLGAALARTDTDVVLAAEGAECVLNGLYVASGTRHVDHHTRIDHEKPRGTSRELYKGILDGHGTAVFNGKVVVHPDAQKTDAEQANHNLLLSDDAVVDTKPQLEIFADDVKCAHGATVGQLDEEPLFYLRSRGIGAEAARDLLIRAFARDVTDRIPVEAVRTRVERLLSERLPLLAAAEAVS